MGKRHLEAWMDSVRLADLGAILIQDIEETNPDQEITYGDRPSRGGRDILRSKREHLGIVISAKIHELYDLKKRAAAAQAIAAWAEGSILEVNYRPDQRLRINKANTPAAGILRDINSIIRIELEANEIPYWEDTMPNGASGSGSTGTASLLIAGTAREIPVEISFTPTGGALTGLTVTVACGGVTRSIQLTDMSVAQNSAVVFGRDNHDRMTIKNGSTSLMSKRTQASADDLVLPAGIATISWSANVSGTAEISARGRWL
jgi:hypothetical protein